MNHFGNSRNNDMPQDYKRKIIQVLQSNPPLTIVCNDGTVFEWIEGKWVYLMTIPNPPQDEIEDLQDGK
jgi:hypothetical protein